MFRIKSVFKFNNSAGERTTITNQSQWHSRLFHHFGNILRLLISTMLYEVFEYHKPIPSFIRHFLTWPFCNIPMGLLCRVFSQKMQLRTTIRNRRKTFSRQNGYTRFSHSMDDKHQQRSGCSYTVCKTRWWCTIRAPDKVRNLISAMHIFSPNPMFNHLLESSHRDDSNKWLDIEFGEEIMQVMSTEINFKYLIWSFSNSTVLC